MKILSSDVAQYFQSESIKRGRIVFTSFLSKEGKFLFLNDHLDRLLKGADFLFPQHQWTYEKGNIKAHLNDLMKTDTSLVYIRLTIFDEFMYVEKKFLVEGHSQTKLVTAIKRRSEGLIPSFLKLSNYLETDLELEEARKKQFDDCLFLDCNGFLTECSTSNIFVVDQNDIVSTPPVSSVVLDGVLRKNLLIFLGKNQIETSVRKIHVEELKKAKEIWLTNSIKGWRNVVQFEDRKYEEASSTVYQKLKLNFGQHGEKYE